MNRLTLALVAASSALVLTAPHHARAQASVAAACSTQSIPTGFGNAYPVITQTGDLCVTGTLTPSGTADVNLKQVNGTTVTVGVGTGAAGTQRVTTSTDSTIGTVTNAVGVKGANGTSITSIINPLPILLATVTYASTSALAANLIVNAGPGFLYSFNVSADSTLSAAAWWVMVYDATTAPADGAVTPVKCYALPSGAPSISAGFTSPESFATGVVIGVSTTGCFTKTASTHAFISGGYR